ncbi:MAG: hypothetical protein HYT64_00780 [Candidatus Yanofskybacteria bacterium]|nr:hypothetical protein [Candidatus Yanofskybacteria bacterium]
MNENDAIGFRMAYRDLVLCRSLTTIFRPDNPKYEGLYREGSVVEARIIRRPGNEELNIPPEFAPERKKVRVKSLKRLELRDLKPEDFAGSSPDVQTVQGLMYHLGIIYDAPASEYTPSTKLIKIELEYI